MATRCQRLSGCFRDIGTMGFDIPDILYTTWQDVGHSNSHYPKVLMFKPMNITLLWIRN